MKHYATGGLVLAALILLNLSACTGVSFSQGSSGMASVPLAVQPPAQGPSQVTGPTSSITKPSTLKANPDILSDRPGLTLVIPFTWLEYNDLIPNPGSTTISLAQDCQSQGHITVSGANFVFTPINNSSPSSPTVFVYQLTDSSTGTTSQTTVTINPLTPFSNGIYATTYTQLYNLSVAPSTNVVSVSANVVYAFNADTLLITDIAMDTQNFLYASDGNGEIYIVDTSGNLTPVIDLHALNGEADIQGMEFMADGRLLFQASNGFYIYNPLTGAAPILLSNIAVNTAGDVTIANNTVYFATDEINGHSLYSIPVSAIGGSPTVVTPTAIGNTTNSPGTLLSGLLPLSGSSNLLGLDTCGNIYQVNTSNYALTNRQTFLGGNCLGGWTGATHTMSY